MAFILRFVQRYRPEAKTKFLELEAQFARLEQRNPSLPQGLRCQHYAGREPSHTLVWQCQFPTLQEAQNALAALEGSPDHARLLGMQVPYMTEAYTEIYEVLEF